MAWWVPGLGSSLKVLKYAAEQQGVPAQAWFEVGTPQAALNVAAKWLGMGQRVHLRKSDDSVMSHGFTVLLVQRWDRAACGRLLGALGAGGLTLANPLDGIGRLLLEGGDAAPIGLDELRDRLGGLDADVSSQFWLNADTDVGFWWQRHGLHGALLIFYLDGLMAGEVSLALAALCRGFVALGGAAAVLACDVESHSQADDWLEAFESGWPPVMPMPCVLMVGEGARPRLRPAPDRRELDDVDLLGRPGDHVWSSLQLLLFP
jgi:hypothetical protein